MRKSFVVRIFMLLAITAGICGHFAQAQDIFSSSTDNSSTDTDQTPDQNLDQVPDQTPDQGDVFSVNTGAGPDQSFVPPTVGDLLSALATDNGSDQGHRTQDPMPSNPFFGMQFRLLAEAAVLEAENPQSEPQSQSGLPLPAGVRNQLFQAAAQLDDISGNAQSYSLAATNRFFRCMSEAVSADLKFLAQPGYVPAAQIARALHQGVWNYLTNNTYDNNLALYNGAVQAMQHTMDDPACAFGQAAPALLVVAATRTASAMAEARQVSRAANAAIALEETAEVNKFANARWYVPGLRCNGCLVYGTAKGEYASFAEAVGGETINSIEKPMNLDWSQFSARVLESALQTKTPVLFSLEGIENIDQVLAGKILTDKTTSFELRYLQRNWPRFQNLVTFYDGGAKVDPPW